MPAIQIVRFFSGSAAETACLSNTMANRLYEQGLLPPPGLVPAHHPKRALDHHTNHQVHDPQRGDRHEDDEEDI